ncbi:tetratricopeptide repeat protein [Kitasatospora sp. SC0581]|uniref:tetratricopeptide repeat protein n=1 Tax=Kitasatospora sp. SC0581 TaxID=3394360 RepID=UPI003A8A7D13
MEETSSDFGSELRRRRGERGFSLAQLSRRVAYSRGHISRVETNGKRASRKFAEACDMALEARGELVALFSDEESRETGLSTMDTLFGLPDAPTHFVGRSEELARIADHLAGESRATVCVLSGLAGVGKTALALQGAWDSAESFPDGCFFFDFGNESPGSPREVLDSLLRLLGVPAEDLPSRPDALANLWRSTLRGRRVLLVLDNVRHASDIAPLLTAEPGCRFLVTSQKRLSALDDAVHLPVGVPGPQDADALFRAVGGERAARAADEKVRSVVEHCGRLPLAVRITAARICSGSIRTVAELEELLSHEAHRLELLDDGDRSIASALAISCNGLTAEMRRLLALLALHPGVSVEPRAVAALANIVLPRARMLVDRLADMHLVEHDASGRIMMHGLVRQFARQLLLPEVTIREQHSAVRRLLESCLDLAVAADTVITPQRYRPPVILDDFPPRPAPFDDRTAGIAWFESEWRSLVALCREAAALKLHSLCWQLAFALRDYFFLTKLWGPWIETHVIAAEAARVAGARAWQAISLGNLGIAHSDRGDLTMAVDCFQRSLSLYQQLGDEHGVVNTISNLAWTELYLGDYGRSLDGLRTALDHYRRLGNRRNSAITLRGMALLEAELGLCLAAVEHAQEARAEFHSLGLELDVVMSVNCAAWVHFRSGNHRAAGDVYEEAVTLADNCGSRYEKARALTGLGNISHAAGHGERAAELWARADSLYGGLEPVMLGEARVRLAS